MSKKILFAAAVLPLLAACSSDVEGLVAQNDNDRFAGIEKVDATFDVVNESATRLANQWGLEQGDIIGFAWLGDNSILALNGNAYQNHPLKAISDSQLKPETSIYVGKYYAYAPYDYSVVSIDKVNFNIANQELANSKNNGNEGRQAVAKNAIFISDQWTDVTKAGHGTPVTDKAGIGETFNLYLAQVSNLAALDLSYINNNPMYGTEVLGASSIKKVKISVVDGSDNDLAMTGFAYAPNTEPTATHSKNYWRTVSNIIPGATATKSAITLTPASPILSTETDNKGLFAFTMLPAETKVTDFAANKVKLEMETTYGLITIEKPLKEVAQTMLYDGEGVEKGWHTDNFDATVTPAGTEVDGTDYISADESFINKNGKRGKFVMDVDFAKAVMNGTHVENDAELQTLLKYYKVMKKGNADPAVSEEKAGTDILLYLDFKPNNNFKLSTASIALLQEINGTTYGAEKKVALKACIDASHYSGSMSEAQIVITGGGEVPSFVNVFEDTNQTVYLADNTTWTWSEGAEKEFDKVAEVKNKGILNVTADMKATSNATPAWTNLKGATMAFNAASDMSFNVTNEGAITIASNARLRANTGCTITNAAGPEKHGTDWGTIENQGTLGVVGGTTGKVYNYGYIHNCKGAYTLITSNQKATSFANAYDKDSNVFGEIKMEQPTDIVSVSNGDAEGFIKYEFTGATYTLPAAGVKYNYLVVKSDINFNSVTDTKVKFVEFDGTNIKVTNSGTNLSALKGIIVMDGKSITLDVENDLTASEAAYVEGEIKLGGKLHINSKTMSKYFSADGSKIANITVWGSATID